MTDESPRSVQVQRAWNQQQVWSAAAGSMKRRIDRARLAALALAIAAAVLAVVSGQVGDPSSLAARVAAGLAAVAAAAMTVVRRRVGPEPIGAWTRARAVSERLKKEVYGYCAGIGPYGEPDADRTLAARTRSILVDVADLQRHLLGIEPAGDPIPAVRDIGSYLSVRVDDQIDRYYRPRAARYERRARRLRWVGDALALAAAVLAALASVVQVAQLAAWVPVVTTIATALTAHAGAARYDELVVEYLRTAQRLEHLRDEYLDDPSADPAALVEACEAAIGAENRGWVAQWSAVADASDR